jgi:hypothetical protein
MKDFEKAPFLDEGGCNVVEFGYADGGGFTNVWVFIAKGAGEGFTEVLCDSIHADAAHGTNGKCSDERVGVIGILF